MQLNASLFGALQRRYSVHCGVITLITALHLTLLELRGCI